MKQVKQLRVRAIAAMAIVILAQSIVPMGHGTIEPLAPFGEYRVGGVGKYKQKIVMDIVEVGRNAASWLWKPLHALHQ